MNEAYPDPRHPLARRRGATIRCTTTEEGATGVLERDQIEDRYKWKLEKIFPDWASWAKAFAEVEAALPGIAALQ